MILYPKCEPWCWYIYLQHWMMFRVNVDDYSIHGAYGCVISMTVCSLTMDSFWIWLNSHSYITCNSSRCSWMNKFLEIYNLNTVVSIAFCLVGSPVSSTTVHPFSRARRHHNDSRRAIWWQIAPAFVVQSIYIIYLYISGTPSSYLEDFQIALNWILCNVMWSDIVVNVNSNAYVK